MVLPMQPDQKSPLPIRDTTLGILVSLYLILLGFFAVLNSFSEDRVDKAGAVLDSVNQSFKAAKRPGIETVDLLAGGGEGVGERALISELRRLFSNAVTFAGSFPSGGDTSLKILLPIAEIFDTDERLSAKAQEQFEALGLLMAAYDNNRRIEVAVFLGIGEKFPSLELTGRPSKALRQAETLSQSLEKIPGLGSNFGVGYIVLEPEFVQLHFRTLAAGRSPLTFTSGRGR
ncbi:MAG: hypothetical protein IH996_01395 [Proteobacteria bacterium]|nr:hypothetical protein [Pseudomonadota bacterium]